MKFYRFRRSDTGGVVIVSSRSKNHAYAEALVLVGPEVLAGTTLTPILPDNKPTRTASHFLDEDRRDRRIEEQLGLPAGVPYYP